MRLPLVLTGVLAMIVSLPAADFPPPEKLPARPGLPDPTVAFDGHKVTTAREWEATRRPELKALFEHYM